MTVVVNIDIEGQVMNIQLLTPKLNLNYKKYERMSNASIRPSIPMQGLTKDTVSFTSGKIPMKVASNTISDYIERGVENNMQRMNRIATTYLDVLESIANSLKDVGYSFDRAYCELSPIKSPKSYVSKIARSGSMTVPDAIRATLYCNKPYDLSSISEHLLPEMRKRGYVLANVETPVSDLVKRGFVPSGEVNSKTRIPVPDLDIRLNDVADQVGVLPPELRYSIGKAQKSGYEDIQMRFVRLNDKVNSPINHELIVLFGPNYAKAKHTESEKVYTFLRQFSEFDMKFEDKTVGSHSQKADRYIDLIQQMFRGKVSQKLFENAKNKDLYDMQDEIPIRFSEEDKNLFNTYFAGLKDRLASCYAEKRKLHQGDAVALKELNASHRHDRTILEKIKQGLTDSIEYFNNPDGVKEVKKATKNK